MKIRCLLALALLLLAPALLAEASMLDDDGILALVNREQKLSKTYVPEGLVKPDVKTRKKSQQERIFMRPEAALALETLFGAALQEMDYTLLAISGYRTYGEQQLLFNNKVAEVGSAAKARRTVAPAGASEHQLGLAMDVLCPDNSGLNKSFAASDEGIWLAENAHRFGFIVRYKEEWSEITGYAYEPWHIRYIGVPHATAVHALNVPLETYLSFAARLPEYVLTTAPSSVYIGVVGQALAGDETALAAICAAASEDEIIALCAPFLPHGESWEQAVWRERPTPTPVPTPRPSPAPYVETEDDVSFPGAA